MQMLSTRGAAPVSPSMAILRGLAPDGGLYVPAQYPSFSAADSAACNPPKGPASRYRSRTSRTGSPAANDRSFAERIRSSKKRRLSVNRSSMVFPLIFNVALQHPILLE